MRNVDESSDQMNSYEEEPLPDSPAEYPFFKPEFAGVPGPVRNVPHLPTWAWIILECLALLILVNQARPYWSPLFSTPVAALSVHRDGDQLRIGWNPAATAQGAKLEILDGAERTSIPISATMSSLTYAPRTGDIEVRFIALEETAEVRRQTVRFLEREPPTFLGPWVAPGADFGRQAGMVRAADENPSRMTLTSSTKGSAPQAPVVPQPEQQNRPSPRAFVPPPNQAPSGVERTTLLDAPPPEPSGSALASATRPPLATNGISAPQVAPPPEPSERVQSQIPAEQASSPIPPAKPAAAATSPATRPVSLEHFQPPFPTRKVQPVLERSAAVLIRRDEQMEIILRVQIDETGRVLAADVVPNTGKIQSPFEKAAVAAAMQWRFEPARLGDKPMRSEHTVHFIFRHQ